MRKQIKKFLKQYGEVVSETEKCIQYYVEAPAPVMLLYDAAQKNLRECRIKLFNAHGGLVCYDVRIQGAWLYGWDA